MQLLLNHLPVPAAEWRIVLALLATVKILLFKTTAGILAHKPSRKIHKLLFKMSGSIYEFYTPS